MRTTAVKQKKSDSASVATESGKKEVDISPPPPPEGQCAECCRRQSARPTKAGERNGERGG